MPQIENWEFNSIELNLKDFKRITSDTEKKSIQKNKIIKQRYKRKAKAYNTVYNRLGILGQLFCFLAKTYSDLST